MDLPGKKKRRENKNLIPKWAFSKKKNINFDLSRGFVWLTGEFKTFVYKLF